MFHLFDFYMVNSFENYSYTVKLRTTHVVNNCVKRHINIPTYSTSAENVMINEYVQGQPMVQQQPFFYPQYPQQPLMPGQYQGNVGTDPFGPQPTTPNVSPQNFQGIVPPMGNVPFGF